MAKTIIDVSEHQGKIDWAAIKPHIDGAIIRCGYGDDDKSQDDKWWTYNVQQCEKLGIPYGVYLYSYADSEAHIKSEIAHVKRLIKGHKPQYPVYIDLEESRYGSIAKKAANEFCKAIAAAGYIAGVYTYESFYNSFMSGWKSYTLWIARYNDNSGKPGTKPNIGVTYDAWQYTSNGRIKGYANRLDISLFYKDFAKSSTSTSTAATSTKVIERGIVAAQIMEHLCTCPLHGYSQPGRYGTSGYCTVKTDAGEIKLKRGDRDCASACGDAWELALQGTKYAGKISRTVWTGNMIDMFVGSGLFVKKPMSFNATTGDIYMVHNSSRQHAAMCIRNDSKTDLLGEFSISETGDIDGKPGDQTGKESSVHDFYDGFACILHYNGKADSEAPSPEPTPTPKPAKAPIWRLSTDKSGKSWLAEKSTGKAGKAIRWLAIKGAGKYRVFTRANGWLPWVNAYNIKDLENGCAGDGSVIEGVQVKSGKYRYAVRVLNGSWYPDMIGTHDTGGSNDNFAGDLANAIDGFRISLA